MKKGIIKLSGTEILIKTKVNPARICQVRLVPKCDSYVIEVIYDEPESTVSNDILAASIDLGLNNLVALTSNQPGFIPLLINGRPLKSINQFYNKRSSHLQSQLKGSRKSSPRIQRLTRCRHQKVDNYLHHTSRLIVDYLVAQQIGTLVIGKNAQWKTEIDLGKQTNQNFVGIPHTRLIEMLEYKARLVGIKVIVQEESYTSKSNVRFVLKKPRNGGNSGSNKVIQYGLSSHFNPLLDDNLFVLWVRTLFKSHPAGAAVKASPLR